MESELINALKQNTKVLFTNANIMLQTCNLDFILCEKQTPMHGHPVFLAQHACACCCRGCLSKWYHVPKGIELNDRQQEQIVNLLMAWIEHQMRDKL